MSNTRLPLVSLSSLFSALCAISFAHWLSFNGDGAPMEALVASFIFGTCAIALAAMTLYPPGG